MIYATVVHKCCCGCGNEVVTPLSPADWQLIYDGRTISLYPSIGSWSLPCKSHYWITHNQIRWASQWSSAEIEAGQAADSQAKSNYIDCLKPRPDVLASPSVLSPIPLSPVPMAAASPPTPANPTQAGWFGRIMRRLFG